MSPEKIDRLARLIVIDLLLESSSKHWLKRADDFAAVGTEECNQIARACRAKAVLCREDTSEWTELLNIELGDAS